MAAISEGQITPIEGGALANLLNMQKDVITSGELERRVEHVKARVEMWDKVEERANRLSNEQEKERRWAT